MRKIAIIGGTGIYSPETLQCFEEKVIQTPYWNNVRQSGNFHYPSWCGT